jgi:hypothetical protein
VDSINNFRFSSLFIGSIHIYYVMVIDEGLR